MRSLCRLLLALATTFALLGANVGMAMDHGSGADAAKIVATAFEACDHVDHPGVAGAEHAPCGTSTASDDCGSDGFCCTGICQLMAAQPFELPVSRPVVSHVGQWTALAVDRLSLQFDRPPRAI